MCPIGLGFFMSNATSYPSGGDWTTAITVDYMDVAEPLALSSNGILWIKCTNCPANPYTHISSAGGTGLNMYIYEQASTPTTPFVTVNNIQYSDDRNLGTGHGSTIYMKFTRVAGSDSWTFDMTS